MVGKSFPEKDHFHENDDQCNQEHEQRNAVNTVHIAHPLAMGRLWVALFYIKIFRQLSPKSHGKDV